MGNPKNKDTSTRADGCGSAGQVAKRASQAGVFGAATTGVVAGVAHGLYPDACTALAAGASTVAGCAACCCVIGGIVAASECRKHSAAPYVAAEEAKQNASAVTEQPARRR